jgi:geranylgeranyl reductase family protein
VTAADVLVVGLGPAGASAARTAAAAGLSVVGVDRRHRIGEPVQCAEFLPNPLKRHTQAEGVRVQPITGMRTFLPSGRRADSDFPGLMIDRARLDQSVAEAAAANGADLRTETRLLSLDTSARRARLKGPHGEYTVEARLIIGADGPHSAVAKAAGLPAQKTVHTRQHTLPLAAPQADTDIYLSPRYPGGYGWVFPRGEVVNVGLGMDRRFGDDLGGPLAELIAQLLAEGRVRDELLARTGGSIPVGGLRPLVHPGPVLLVGDAGGLTHPITGAGIPAALVSGERAGEAAAEYLAGGDSEALADFEEDVRDQFAVSVERGRQRRLELEAVWNRPEAAEDGPHRRGWIAFPEYYEAAREPEPA